MWWGVVIGAVSVIVAAAGLELAWPGYRQARRSEFQRRVLEAVTGSPNPPPPSPQNPSLSDVLIEIRDLLAEQNAMQTVLAYHLSDDHGPGKIPEWMLKHS